LSTDGKTKLEAHDKRKEILQINLNRMQKVLEKAEEQLIKALGQHETRGTQAQRVQLTAKAETALAKIAEYEETYKDGLH
jgi:hypothetical protein